MSNIPTEIFYYILEYLGDIDIRRFFGNIRKINLTEYSILQSITRTINPGYCRELPNYLYRRYDLQNVCAVPTRKLQHIDDDMIDMKVCIHNEMVMYNFGIYRLKLKTLEKPIAGEYAHHKGDLEDYYWDTATYSHRLE